MVKLIIFLSLVSLISCKKVDFEVVDSETGKPIEIRANIDLDLTLDVDSLSNKDRWNVTLRASKALKNVELSDIEVVNADILSVEKISDEEFLFVIAPRNNGKVIARLSESGFEKFLGSKPDVAVNKVEALFDNIAADVELSHSVGLTTNQASWTFDVAVDEKIDELTESDFDLVNCTISNIQFINDLLYRVTVSPVSEGLVSIDIADGKIKDLAQNLSENILGLSTTFDTTAPVVTISNTPLPAINAHNRFDFNLGGNCNTGDGAVSINVGGEEFTSPCTSGSWVVANLSTVADGLGIDILISQTDASGNEGIANSTVDKETTMPNVSMTVPSQDINISNQTSYNLNGNCSTADGDVTILINSEVLNTTSCNSGAWSFNDFSTVSDGSNLQIKARQIDAYGNIGAANVYVDKDTQAPSVVLTQSVSSFSYENTWTVTATFSEEVDNLDISDFDVTNATKGVLNSSDQIVYTFEITAQSVGDVTVSLNAGLANDLAQNNSLASNLLTTEYKIPPYFAHSHPTTEYITIPQSLVGFNSLANNSVSKVLFNSEGTMFVATKAGLSISNDGGQTFVTKTTAQGIGSNYILDIFIDGADNVYVATNGGLSISTDKGATFTTKNMSNSDLTTDSILCVYVTETTPRKLYVGMTGRGIAISSDGGESFEIKNRINNSLAHDAVFGLHVNSSGHIYAATQGGLSYSTDGGETFETKNNELTSFYLWDIAVDSNGIVYLTSNDGLFISKDSAMSGHHRKNTTDHGIGSNVLRKVFVDANGIVYVTSSSGLAISTDSTANSFTLHSHNSSDSTTMINSSTFSVMVTTTGTIYASTDGGISISTDAAATFSHITSPTISIGMTKQPIVVANNGDMYVGSGRNSGAGGGLGISTDGGLTYSLHNLSLSNLADSNVLSIYVNENGKAFVGHGTNGVSILENSGADYTSLRGGLYSDDVNHIREINQDLYASLSTGFGISTFDGSSYSNFSKYLFTTNNGRSSNKVYDSFVDSDGYIYVATQQGLLVSVDNGVSFQDISDTVFSSTIQSQAIYVSETTVGETVTKTIILGSSQGIYLSLPSSNNWDNFNSASFGFVRKTTSNGLADYSVRQIAEDSSGKIYVATGKGLSISEDGGASFVSKTTLDGLPANDVDHVFVDSNNKVYVGTQGGFGVLNN